ncbi:TPA: hypothetical protein EYN98_14310 [Candidatus Poribacteria bacterium]|nr:hypothetical protein [Candidatus Poribacteria bacterium]
MEIKNSDGQHWISLKGKKNWLLKNARSWKLSFYLFIGSLFMVYSLLIFIYGGHCYSEFEDNIKSVRDSFAIFVSVSFSRIRQTKKADQIRIDIKPKNFRSLSLQRERALRKDKLFVTKADYVPAMIQHGDEAIKVKLRLKGDHIDHLQGKKWSFRIIVKGNNTILGMKRFSIHHPKTRNYLNEWLFHQTLRREGLLGLRYQFIRVVLNQEDLGIYALEEHFDEYLLGHNQLHDGPIVRFNEEFFWKEIAQKSAFNQAKMSSGSYLSSGIDTFQTTKWISKPSNHKQYLKAVHLLELFRRGQLKTSQVFDVEKLAKFFALTDLMGAEHGSRWHNARFYYNPITSKLQPIGFDGNAGQPVRSLCATINGNYLGNHASQIGHSYYARVFYDETFFRRYVKALNRISEPAYLDNLFASLDVNLAINLNILKSEFFRPHFSKKVYRENQEYIKAILNPVKGLHAYQYRVDENEIELQVASIQPLPIEVDSVSYKDSVTFQANGKIILPAKVPRKLTNYQNIKFGIPADFAWDDSMRSNLKINYRILGTDQTRSETVFPWSYMRNDFAKHDFIRQSSNIHAFDFLKINEELKQISIQRGTWTIDQDLIVPEDYHLVCPSGVKINLIDSATILSYSSIYFIGNEEEPIVISSDNSSGQGLTVMSSSEQSVLKFVKFHNLAASAKNGWELTGAITFYESPVQIANCQFIGSRSEDSLHIMRSEFMIRNTVFSHSFSDALDIDFCEGEVMESSFLHCGNDAIDVSGSIVQVKDVTIDGCGDKGLSAGENSEMLVHRVDIKNAKIGLASKDLSQVSVDQLKIDNSHYGLVAFQKKPEFSGGLIMATHLEMKNIKTLYLVEEKSAIVINQKKINTYQEDVKKILYGVKDEKSML